MPIIHDIINQYKKSSEQVIAELTKILEENIKNGVPNLGLFEQNYHTDQNDLINKIRSNGAIIDAFYRSKKPLTAIESAVIDICISQINDATMKLETEWNTPLQCAAMRGEAKIINFLMKYYAQTDQEGFKSQILNHFNGSGITPFLYIIYESSLIKDNLQDFKTLCTSFIEAGVDLNKKVTVDEQSALHGIIEADLNNPDVDTIEITELVHLFVKNGANINDGNFGDIELPPLESFCNNFIDKLVIDDKNIAKIIATLSLCGALKLSDEYFEGIANPDHKKLIKVSYEAGKDQQKILTLLSAKEIPKLGTKSYLNKLPRDLVRMVSACLIEGISPNQRH